MVLMTFYHYKVQIINNYISIIQIQVEIQLSFMTQINALFFYLNFLFFIFLYFIYSVYNIQYEVE